MERTECTKVFSDLQVYGGTYLNIVKAVFSKPIANTKLNGVILSNLNKTFCKATLVIQQIFSDSMHVLPIAIMNQDINFKTKI